jgi:hypothetical protein
MALLQTKYRHLTESSFGRFHSKLSLVYQNKNICCKLKMMLNVYRYFEQT